jgi:hypothetical protein
VPTGTALQLISKTYYLKQKHASPHGEDHFGSPAFHAFHSAKSVSLRFYKDKNIIFFKTKQNAQISHCQHSIRPHHRA